jgi:hypothetical protein
MKSTAADQIPIRFVLPGIYLPAAVRQRRTKEGDLGFGTCDLLARRRYVGGEFGSCLPDILRQRRTKAGDLVLASFIMLPQFLI